ncbi:MAG: pyrroline-5-carboxylate reductase [Chloroflexi bacterium]|nr:pyrroline-5-carboxylate reductase [Chloroflexota bacterium]
MRIGFIGGGYMGEALAAAFLKEGLVAAGDVTISDVAESRRSHLSSAYGVSVTDQNSEAAAGADVVVLAVKPQEFANVAAGLRGALSEGQTLLSIMAGVSIERIVEETGHRAVVRVMPNTAAFVAEAMSVWTASSAVADEAKRGIAGLLDAMGRELEVSDESYLDMATAVSGSGPGFVFYFLEGLIDGALEVGFDREQAEALAVQTLYGAACLARESDKDAGALREMVTSKGGTTAAGLQKLDDAGVRDAMISAVVAAHERAKEL